MTKKYLYAKGPTCVTSQQVVKQDKLVEQALHGNAFLNWASGRTTLPSHRNATLANNPHHSHHKNNSRNEGHSISSSRPGR
jgi:hypothetical protein